MAFGGYVRKMCWPDGYTDKAIAHEHQDRAWMQIGHALNSLWEPFGFKGGNGFGRWR